MSRVLKYRISIWNRLFVTWLQNIPVLVGLWTLMKTELDWSISFPRLNWITHSSFYIFALKSLFELFTPVVNWWDLHKSPSDRKSPQLHGALLRNLADLSKISCSPNLFPRFVGTVSRAPIIIDKTTTFMFNYFFLALWQDPTICLSCCLSFHTLWSAVAVTFTRWKVIFVLLTRSQLLRLVFCISKSKIILWVSFTWINPGLCIYHESV